MNSHSLFKKVLGAIIAWGIAISLHAQGVVSSSLTGLVRDNQGKAVVGATVTATHTPTGTSYTATTSGNGRYNISGMVVGGPYTVSSSANGFKAGELKDVYTQLGATVDANVRLEPASEIVTLEKFKVVAEANALDSGASGAGSIIDSGSLTNTPTVQRSFADVVTKNQFVDLRSILASRAQPIISALGQNNRFNSVMVDGARLNDQFGLNGSGFQGFTSPVSLDSVEQFSVAVSPYDAGQSGFTGAAINAVTKSGTNQFHGALYQYYTDQDYQGKNVFGSTTGLRPQLKQKTKGFVFGGPIIPNRLFFFVNYEKFDSITSDTTGLDPTGSTQGTADMAIINARLAAIKATAPNGSAYDFGTLLGKTASVAQSDRKKLAKIDWNITSTQRLSVRYNKTEGALPDTAKFKAGGSTGTVVNAISGSGIATAVSATDLSSNLFTQTRVEEVWAGQLFSQWTSDFKTELHYAKNDYSQPTTTPIAFPEIYIFGVNGVNAAGANISTGALTFGTENNRQGNFVSVATKSYSGFGEYTWNQFTFKGGFDREQSDFINLFRSGSYGIFNYASPAAFAADTPAAFSRNYYVTGTSPYDISNFAINGLYAQAKWDVNSRLNVNFGLRYDFFTTNGAPPLNTTFQSVFGFANNATVDGTNSISPRVNFNLAVDDDRTVQIRGGAGHFLGRIPWVLVSNSWSNPGIGRTGGLVSLPTGTATTPPTLNSYLQTSFDPKNPIGQVGSATITGASMNLIKKDLAAPSVWRGNLAVDAKLPLFDSVLSVEAVSTLVDQALFIRNLNLKPTTNGSDGRQRFAGSVNTTANRLHPEFSDALVLDNVHKGTSTYISFGLNRPMKNKWSYNFVYTLGKSKDAMLLGETVAFSLWQRNPIFNQNTPEVARSAFEIRDRVQLSLTREFEFIKKAKTSISLYYEGRTGNPYSFTYSGDLNGDGQNGNDLIYVPTSTADPVFANLPAAVAASYMSFIDGGALSKYKGGIAPRNALTAPWINRLDLHVSQVVPLYFRTAELEVFADFINFGAWLSTKTFGYTETITGGGDNELLSVANLGNAAYDAAGQLRMTGTAYVAPAVATPNNELSRWRIQLGARLKF